MSRSAAQSDREMALDLCPILRPVTAELDIYETLLRAWQKKINLVSAQTLPSLWLRHFADSAQIAASFPDILCWADLGSGGGFPGMVTALLLKGREGAVVHLIESDQRKAAFLRAVSRETGAPAIVHVGRIEQELPALVGKIEGVSARALAPLPQLVAWSQEVLWKGGIGAFLKGEDWRNELTSLEAEGSFQFRTIASRTNSAARLIAVAKEFRADRQFSGQVSGD
ncbi:16S rRNA (guanine(527)-N(7))-methyltransferase RsmG [Methylocystis heyeri]|uniref:Ribosomal RNA small subunit methyltransferase G n=1 Tax=Methylocystis heyeri TaxID=391905 RepID=A0A6B8KH76_9HYPH|nr:16S rRNA (guanine(527)-N(7))-methyltransferase RsmG [Methylocystis heyeri]QGM47077.1 16S rRNA (guanine(527)-N(7))-methyltransferase RsmG [Methylocystis heyeri]